MIGRGFVVLGTADENRQARRGTDCAKNFRRPINMLVESIAPRFQEKEDSTMRSVLKARSPKLPANLRVAIASASVVAYLGGCSAPVTIVGPAKGVIGAWPNSTPPVSLTQPAKQTSIKYEGDQSGVSYSVTLDTFEISSQLSPPPGSGVTSQAPLDFTLRGNPHQIVASTSCKAIQCAGTSTLKFNIPNLDITGQDVGPSINACSFPQYRATKFYVSVQYDLDADLPVRIVESGGVPVMHFGVDATHLKPPGTELKLTILKGSNRAMFWAESDTATQTTITFDAWAVGVNYGSAYCKVTPGQ